MVFILSRNIPVEKKREKEKWILLQLMNNDANETIVFVRKEHTKDSVRDKNVI